MSLISRLKAVVAGDEYLDDEFDEFDYASEDELEIPGIPTTFDDLLLFIKSNGFEFARAFAFFGFCLKLLISFNSSSEG